MSISFYKYQGTGNDFIILDNRMNEYDNISEDQIKMMCDRKFGIGADGLMMLGASEQYDFSMKYFNADGKEGSMCGNGGRCLVKFAEKVGINKKKFTFIAVDGEHKASIDGNGEVKLKMQDVHGIESIGDDKILNTGSPHYIKYVHEVEKLDVFNEGRKIRYNEQFKDQGINVNFVEINSTNPNVLSIRTYERGVENETLSCGTGATASAIASTTALGKHHIQVNVLGGELKIEFERKNEDEITDVWLIGPANFVFKGEITFS
jgi:diaminopimelate epimerase